MTYDYEDWLDLINMLDNIDHMILEDDIYELEKHELEIFHKATDFIKQTLKIHTGIKLVYSEMTDKYYIANVWYHHRETDLIIAISKRPASEAEIKGYASSILKRNTSQIRD